ncbi:MAG TPA: sigma-54 dependent transcriptional regulator, partial [Syntrophorhabdaceae bacterium]|nr:sigma-54 dependent transcriptional regulator [Syntrophorhabdaceae bacterium]HPL42185.1 sigma-54 dependent transcriptional regulator [Syntrophorhabdaceae bacterium]HQI57449.1 sigma-54 dependent transcriptional regulator [Syntrophorhabdaceae bacterium]
MIRILIVDDEYQLIDAFRKKLSKEGMEVLVALNGKDAINIIKNESIDIGLFDIRLPDINGVDLLGKLKEMQPTAEVIMLTGHASVDTAIKSMKLGAYDYLTKPCRLVELHNVILKAYEKKQLKEKNIVLEEHIHRIEIRDRFIGESKEMKEIKKFISLVSNSNAPVLLLGETGTGKEVVARQIHTLSHRSANPFVTINASCLQESILESELFGYKKGAFTGAQTDKLGLIEIANKGTFFVDEVGDMGTTIQAKLLRVLENSVFRKLGDTKEIKVDVRFIFATNKNIEKEIETNRFRKDLFYRLNTFIIKIPPLVERKDDIPLIANYFIEKFTLGGKRKIISKHAIDILVNHSWHGNVRELANALERAVLVSADREEIIADDLPYDITHTKAVIPEFKNQTLNQNKLRLDVMEKEHIEKVLKLADGNKSKAARLLGISRKKL